MNLLKSLGIDMPWNGRSNAAAYHCAGNEAPSVAEGFVEIVTDPQFWIAAVASGIIGTLIYATFGYYIHSKYGRKVDALTRNGESVARPYAIHWSSDFCLAVLSLLVGSPIISGMGIAHQKWCVMGTYLGGPYLEPWGGEHPWGLAPPAALAYWLLSIPVYMLLWDFHFYWLHLCLHMEPIYSLSHANHHAFKPPVAWSGIAIDPIEQMFSGLGPYFFPMLLPLPFLGYLPFHLPTVYVINICLVAWATLLHSSSTHPGSWLFMGPIYHNRHHATGRLRNGNYGAIFKVYDRAFGTLLEDDMGVPDYAEWTKEEAAARREALPGLPVGGGKGGKGGKVASPLVGGSSSKGRSASASGKKGGKKAQ